MTAKEPRKVTLAEWKEEGRERFGEDPMDWKFVCPLCGHVASIQDWKKVGATIESAAFSCVGRWLPKCRSAFFEKGPGPCDYTGGGLFRLNPVHILMEDGKVHEAFEFADG